MIETYKILTQLSQLTRLTHLRTDWINFGRIRILFMIFELSWKEPEVVVKYLEFDMLL